VSITESPPLSAAPFTAFYESEIIVRAEGRERILVGLIVPWDVATPVDHSGRFAVPGGPAWESFQRGALAKSLRDASEARQKAIPMLTGRHPLNPAESAGRTPAAVLHRSESLEEGQVAEFKLFRNYEGEEAEQMAEARIWTGFSISYGATNHRTVVGELNGRRHFLRQEVRLDHVLFCRNPAYPGAELLAMRAELEAADPGIAIRARARMRRLRYLYS
jgi:hypothetical protein